MKKDEIKETVMLEIKASGHIHKTLGNNYQGDARLKCDLGYDSLDLMELEIELEKKFLVQLDFEFTDNEMTIDMVVDQIHVQIERNLNG